MTVEHQLTSFRFAQERSFVGRPIASARARDLYQSTWPFDGDLEWRNVSLSTAHGPTRNDQEHRDNDEEKLAFHVWPPCCENNILGGL